MCVFFMVQGMIKFECDSVITNALCLERKIHEEL